MNKTRLILFFSAVLFLMTAVSTGDHVMAASAMKDDTIVVQGSASVSAAPDRAVIRLGVEVEAKTAEEARAKAAASIKLVQEALMEAGIGADDISTANFSVQPSYHFSNDGGRELTGFVVQHILQVETPDVEKAGMLVDAAVKAGANRVDSVQFTLKDAGRLEIQALTLALDEAQVKAEALAKAAGMKIVSIHQIVEQDMNIGIPFTFAKMQESDTVILPGQVQVQKSVTVTYRVK